MNRINNYLDFINEELFKKVFKKSKNNSKKIKECIKDIIGFLKENEISSWDDFMTTSALDREIINKIIDETTSNMNELEEVRFGIRLELSDKTQLREYLKDLEAKEEYEKCALIVKKISSK